MVFLLGIIGNSKEAKVWIQPLEKRLYGTPFERIVSPNKSKECHLDRAKRREISLFDRDDRWFDRDNRWFDRDDRRPVRDDRWSARDGR